MPGFLLLLIGLSLDSLKVYLNKNFSCYFQEIAVYKEIATSDTFIGTITRKDNTLIFEIKKPTREVYKILNDTLFVEANGKVTKEPLSDQALKFLNFSFLEDTTTYRIATNDSILYVYPRDSTDFNHLKLTIKGYIPKKLELDDNQRKLIFKFSRWQFHKDQ